MEAQENLENKQSEKKLANTEIPEYVEGIPTEKKKVRERFALIKSYYEKLWKDLQRKSGGNSIHNKFLDADVYIVKNESDKKTAREALHNWKSTYAVKHLKQVVENAGALEGMPLFSSIKSGAQKKNGYKNMVLLYYKIENEQKAYLNFVVKVTIGVTASDKHIQYSVNKVEVSDK